MTHDLMTRYWYEDENGHVTPAHDIVEWARWFSDHDAVVAVTRIPSPDPDYSETATVSTVFVGIQPDPLARPPAVYETAIFEENRVIARKLSTSREDATAAHYELVEKYTSLQ